MMDLKKLIDLLPYYFKEADTYKDSNGKGILERFLEICGSYLEDQVTLDTESLLDNLDVEQCPEHFLQYFWEWFGCIPFAEGEFIDPNKWAQYYNGFDSQVQYNQKKQNWIHVNKNNPLPNLTLSDKRRILRYALSLIKCRGSKIFFETMFRLYGVECISIVTPLDDNYQGSDKLEDHTIKETILDDGKDGEYLLFDNDQKFDWDTYCSQCIPVYFTIRYTGDSNSEACKNFMQAIINFINKYIPFNAHPIVRFVDSNNDPLYGGIVYYIRATNVLTGDSAIFASQVQGNDNRLRLPVSYSDRSFTYFVEVWSSEDPNGDNSTWAPYTSDELNGSWNNLDPNTLPKKLNKGYGVVNFSNQNDLDGRHQILNLQSLEAYLQGTLEDVRVAYIYLVAEDPDVNLDSDPSSSVRYEFSIKSEDEDGNETFSPSIIGTKDKLYVKAIKYEYVSGSGIVTSYPEIAISPSGLTVGTSRDSEGYVEITDLKSGYYNISIKEAPIYNGYVQIQDGVYKYLVKCEPVEQTVKSIDEVQDVKITIEPEGLTPGTPEYDSAMELVYSDYSALYELTSNIYYSYPEEGFIYKVHTHIKYFGIYKFICTLNPSNIQLEDKYTGKFTINRDTGLYTLVRITSVDPEIVNLNDTQGNPSARTVRVNLELYGNSNFTFKSDPSLNGTMRVQVQENSGGESAEKWFSQYSGNRVSGYGFIYKFKDKIIRVDDTHAYMDLEVPFVTLDDSQHNGFPCTGTLTFQYGFPLVQGVSPGSSNESTCRVTFSYIVPPSVDYISIVPENSLDTNWRLFNNEGTEINWGNYYPNENADGSYKPCLGQAIYLKQSEGSTCEFTLSGIVDGITYSFEPEDPSEQGFTDVQIEDTYEVISLNKPGRYTFGDSEGIWKSDPNDTSESYKPMVIIVKDYPVTPSMLCTPTQKIIPDNELDETAKVDKITLTLSPDNPRANHQIAIFKVKEGGRASSGAYVVTSVEKLLGIFEADSLASGYTINEIGDFVFAWVGNFQNQDGNYTTSDWALAKENWEEGVNFCAFIFRHQSDFIGGIQVNPTQDYINTTKKTASTRVVLIDLNGKELTGSDYLIKGTWSETVTGGGTVPRDETHESPWNFETSLVGTYTFSYAYNDKIKGTFQVSDVSPTIGGVNIIETGVSAEAPYVGPHSLNIQIMDGSGRNISDDPQITYDYLISSLAVYVKGQLLASGGYRLEKGNGQWTITFINDITWTEDGTISIGIEGGYSDTWAYTYVEPVVPSGVEISSLSGVLSTNRDNHIPGDWNMIAKIKKSNGDYMLEREFEEYNNQGTLYVNGTPYTYYPGSWMDSTFRNGNYFTMGQVNPGDNFWMIFVYLKDSPSSVYWRWNNMDSNVLQASGDPEINPDDYLVLMATDYEYNENEWGTNNLTLDSKTSSSSDRFYICPGHDGENWDHEPIQDTEQVKIDSITGGKLVVGSSEVSSGEILNIGYNTLSSQEMVFSDVSEGITASATFSLVRFPSRTIRASYTNKSMPMVIENIKTLKVTYSAISSISEDNLGDITISWDPKFSPDSLGSNSVGDYITLVKRGSAGGGLFTPVIKSYSVNWEKVSVSEIYFKSCSIDGGATISIGSGSYSGGSVDFDVEDNTGSVVDTVSGTLNIGSGETPIYLNSRTWKKFGLMGDLTDVNGTTLNLNITLYLRQ